MTTPITRRDVHQIPVIVRTGLLYHLPNVKKSICKNSNEHVHVKRNRTD